MPLSIFFEDKTLMNEVLARCNLRQYSICNSVYNGIKKGVYIVIDDMDSIDNLLSLLCVPDDITTAINRNVNSYTTSPTKILLSNNEYAYLIYLQ